MNTKPAYEELEQRIKELAALESKRKNDDMMLQRLFDLSIDMLCVADINDGCFKHLNNAFEKTLEEFDNIVGMAFLKAMHLNDSKKPIGSRVDRHESIGKGTLGTEPFRFIMSDPRFDNIPMVLETPDSSIWDEEIRLLYSLVEP